jgi:Fe2+ or Zn2+ uptake regulation protein
MTRSRNIPSDQSPTDNALTDNIPAGDIPVVDIPVVDITKALHAQGLRVTEARCSVYSFLEEAREPLAASQIEEGLRKVGEEFDLVTVYRTIETLERCALVARVDRLREGWRYIVRSRRHGHLITCSECGESTAMATCELERLERSLAEATGYTNIRHSLQFFGTCPECRPSTPIISQNQFQQPQ